jgi:AAA15 family ATPase/GTPase
MFTKISIDNFQGISNRITLDFIAHSRNKEILKSVVKTHDGIYLYRLAGIIGGNASGKTSIINAISKVGNIITSPVMSFNIEEEIEKVNKLMEKNQENIEEIRNLWNTINSSTDIHVQNMRRESEDTEIDVEMYISDDENEDKLTGYYRYKVRFNGINSKITQEYFSYRNKYSAKEKIIININDINQSQIYYINKYFNNISDFEIRNIKEIEEKHKYCAVFKAHYINNSAIIDTSENCNYKKLSYIDWFKKSPEFFKSLIKIVDTKIKDIVVETDSEYESLIYILDKECKITGDELSTGTKRFLNLIRYVIEIIEKNGVLVIDEIEQNIHKELIELIIKLFGEIQHKNAQILFTTHYPEIFDIIDINNNKVFKQDSIFIINNCNYDITVEKLSKILIDGKRVKGDALVSSLYKNRKISCHPDREQIFNFLENFRNKLE